MYLFSLHSFVHLFGTCSLSKNAPRIIESDIANKYNKCNNWINVVVSPYVAPAIGIIEIPIKIIVKNIYPINSN